MVENGNCNVFKWKKNGMNFSSMSLELIKKIENNVQKVFILSKKRKKQKIAKS